MTDESKDNYKGAENRTIPFVQEVFRVDISEAGTKTVVIPMNIKVSTIQSPVPAECSVALKKSDEEDPAPGDLTGGTSTKKIPLEASYREPIVQQQEYNTFFIAASETSDIPVLIRVGSGLGNELTTSGYIGADE